MLNKIWYRYFMKTFNRNDWQKGYLAYFKRYDLDKAIKRLKDKDAGKSGWYQAEHDDRLSIAIQAE